MAPQKAEYLLVEIGNKKENALKSAIGFEYGGMAILSFEGKFFTEDFYSGSYQQKEQEHIYNPHKVYSDGVENVPVGFTYKRKSVGVVPKQEQYSKYNVDGPECKGNGNPIF